MVDRMIEEYSISLFPTDPEKQPDHLLEGYPLASDNGFLIGKDHGKVVGVVEIQGEHFQRHLPAPVHSSTSFTYTSGDSSCFPCCNYPDRILLSGGLEEERVLEQRLRTFRKEANELKEVTKGMKETLQKIDELTNAGDLASGFQYHELLNKQSKKAETITRVAASSKDANTILTNTLEYRMKAAGDIAEYEQAQVLKNTLEVTYCFKSNT